MTRLVALLPLRALLERDDAVVAAMRKRRRAVVGADADAVAFAHDVVATQPPPQRRRDLRLVFRDATGLCARARDATRFRTDRPLSLSLCVGAAAFQFFALQRVCRLAHDAALARIRRLLRRRRDTRRSSATTERETETETTTTTDTDATTTSSTIRSLFVVQLILDDLARLGAAVHW